MTEWAQHGFAFEGHFSRRVVAEFSGDRLSNQTMRAHQLRLYFSSLAYLLPQALRRIALGATQRDQAQAETIRLRLLKIAAHVRLTARRIRVFTQLRLSVETSVRRRWVGTALLNHLLRQPPSSRTGNQGEIRLPRLRNSLPTLSQSSITPKLHLPN